MLVSAGYPGDYPKGLEITALEGVTDSIVFHCGTSFDHTGDRVVTSGGRVIAVTSLANGLALARDKAYRSVNQIDFLGKTFRRDIGLDVMNWPN